jgi:tyrosinase
MITMLGLFILLLSVLTTATPSPISERAAGPDDVLAATALSNVYKILDGSLSDGSKHTTCTNATLRVRKE